MNNVNKFGETIDNIWLGFRRASSVISLGSVIKTKENIRSVTVCRLRFSLRTRRTGPI